MGATTASVLVLALSAVFAVILAHSGISKISIR
jgi:hypothetical protein